MGEILKTIARHRLLAAVLIGLVGGAAAVGIGRLPAVQTFERQTLDIRFRYYADTSTATDKIVVVDINEQSVVDLEPYFGRWPWPRDAHAQVVQYLRMSGAKSVAFDVLFSERTARKEVREETYERLRSLIEAARSGKEPAAADALATEISTLNPGAGDDALVQMTQFAGNVTYAMIFKRGQFAPDDTAIREALDVLAPFALRQRASEAVASGAISLDAVFDDATIPMPELARAGAGVAHINHAPDPDGPARWTFPVLAYRDLMIPSLPLASAARDLGVPVQEIRLEPGRLIVGNRVAPLDERGRMPILYQGSRDLSETKTTVYAYRPVYDVLVSAQQYLDGQEPLIPPDFFQDKVVFIGTSAAGLFDLRATPFSAITPGVEIHCHVADDLMANRFLRTTPPEFETTVAISLALLVALAGTYMRPALGFLWAAVLVGGYDYTAFQALPRSHMWVEVVVPTLAAAIAYLLLVVYKYMTEQREKRQIRGAFGRYLPPAVLAEVLSNPKKLRLGGEKRTVTLLFSDVAGFTSMSEVCTPEEVAHILNEYLTRMTDCVFRNGGTLDKFIGDAVMAEFGAPIPQEDHAARACRTALDMFDELAVLQAKWKAENRPVLKCRIGINSGEAIIGNMGSDQLFDYTAIGNTVNTAARLEPLCKDFHVRCLVSGLTAEGATGQDADLVVREVAQVIVKGRATALPVCELVGRRSKVPPEKLKVLETFAAGYALYRARDFAGAQAKFREALAADPEDGPSEVYVELCDEMIESPPPAEWQGSYEQKTK